MKFANQPDNSEKGAGGRNQKPLLLVLLALVAVFAYLYFFTGLIKPRQEEPPVPPPVAEVKKPLPPRPDGEKGQPAETAVKAPEAAAKAAPAEQKPKGGEPAASGAKPQPVPAPAPAAKAPEKAAPAKAVAPPAKEAAKPAPAGKEVAKPAPATEGSGKGKAPPQQAASGEKAPKAEKGAVKQVPATVDKAAKPVKNNAAAAAAKKDIAGKKTGKEPVKKTAGAVKKAAVTLLVGEFVPDRDFLALQTRLKNMGLSPLHKTELKRAKPMNRLYVGEYPNYDAGVAELERVKKLSADAFFIEAGGMYRVYAGSYYSSRMADQVRSGLAAKGVSTTLQKADIPVTVVRLTAGCFADKAAAAGTIKKLKATGLAPAVVPLAR